jgi:MFS transporter, ACS family, tartrate transporter
MGPFWALPGTFLSGTAAAAGIALVNSLGNVMGFATPYALGLIKDAVGGYTIGLALLALLPLAGAVLALRLRRAPLFTRGLRPVASPVAP